MGNWIQKPTNGALAAKQRSVFFGWVWLAALGWLGSVVALPAERLLWHEVRLDDQGKLLSWVQTPAPYDQVVRNAWASFLSIPVQSNGYRTYFSYPTFYGPNDPRHPVYSGRPWVHNPITHYRLTR